MSRDVDTLLAWYNLLFYIPLTFGVLLVIGAAVGLDAGLDADADGDGIPDILQHIPGGDALTVFGFGKCPVLIILATMALLFGGVGTGINLFLQPLLDVSSIFVVPSFLVAFVAMFFGTSLVARVVGRWMPSTETTSLTREELIGVSGTAVLPISDTEGVVLLRHKGDVFQAQARTNGEVIPRDTDIITIEYHAGTNLYIVVAESQITA